MQAPVMIAWSLIALLGTACAADEPASRELNSDGVAMHVQIPDSEFAAGPDPLVEWIRRSADIVTHYYGRFPVADLRIRVQPVSGAGVQGGTTYGEAMGRPGGYIRVRVGRDVSPAQLLDDWVLVHEMIHLALPDVGEEHSWLSEGISVYVEGIARAQAGNRTVQDVWTEQFHSMPKGLPQAGDRGLDNTHTWGRTYWGGALFCLEADVEIHRRTHNRFGLREALRAVNRESGGLVADWPVQRVFSVADGAVGFPVLEDLYARMKDAPVAPDLTALWQQLGVEPQNQSMRLRDDAPLAEVRKAIMRPAP